jgi:hypothetical protein
VLSSVLELQAFGNVQRGDGFRCVIALVLQPIIFWRLHFQAPVFILDLL